MLDTKDRMYYYTIDSEGHLWHRGTELEDPKIIRIFMQGMEPLPQPDREYRWRVFCMGEECRVAAEDVPYVIQKWEQREDVIELVFPGDYREMLNPSSLVVGKGNVLYCEVRGGRFLARFNRQPYLDIAKMIHFDRKQKVYYLLLNGQRYSVKGV